MKSYLSLIPISARVRSIMSATLKMAVTRNTAVTMHRMVSLNRAAAFAGTYPQAENEVLLGKTAARVLHVGSGDTVTLTLPDGTEKPLTVTGVGGIDEDFYGEQYSIVDAYLPQEAFAALAALVYSSS